MKKIITIILTLTFMAMVLVACSSDSGPKEFTYNFSKDDSGFKAVFADYHDDGNNYESYEMDSYYADIPVESVENKGIYICSHNRSDDMFMGYIKKLEGLKKNTEYQFTIDFKLATNVVSGGMGIGGGPADSVYVKAGISSVEPQIEKSENNIFRFTNIDVGIQSNSGKNAIVVGNIGKPEENFDESFAFKEFNTEIKATTDVNGCVYLIIGTDSGFEGFTEYYLDDISIVSK